MGRSEAGLLPGNIPYVRGGTGPKTVVVFFGVNALFRRIDRVNPDRYAGMIAPLLPPGHAFWILGYEDDPPPDFGLDAIATRFARILRDRIGPTAAVMGASFGGFVAQRLAAAHGELVDRLILLVSAHRFSPEGRRRVDAQLAHLRRGDPRALVRENALLFRRPWFNVLVRLKLWRDRNRPPAGLNPPDAIARAYEALFGPDFDNNADHAARIRARTLIVGGTRDQFFDEAAFAEAARIIPAAHLALFPRETHMLPVERRAAVARVIGEFLG